MSTRVKVQVQDFTGVWRTLSTTQNNEQLIYMRMLELQRRYPNRSIRAIDGHGNILNIS